MKTTLWMSGAEKWNLRNLKENHLLHTESCMNPGESELPLSQNMLGHFRIWLKKKTCLNNKAVKEKELNFTGEPRIHLFSTSAVNPALA